MVDFDPQGNLTNDDVKYLLTHIFLSGVEFKLVKVATLTNGTYNYIEKLSNLNLNNLNNFDTAIR